MARYFRRRKFCRFTAEAGSLPFMICCLCLIILIL